MEKANLGGKTWAEEEEERLAEKAREEGWVPTSVDKAGRRGRFGYLREVGVRSFVQAVEEEDRRVWVVVHIYDPSLDRQNWIRVVGWADSLSPVLSVPSHADDLTEDRRTWTIFVGL
ncbi:hypothetical protein A0H81_13113 [Grifola frondosa]|uniref:Uncharacterized protein n=1 Tax=Grifola frondosa TaxID=5627 RepID=A0A1C7LPH5_GRIFR|nr:hypothetical protein A0H81_13113 [Grifola frondosa]